MDYSLIRTPATELTELEMGYCENDILVLYYYIKYELETYEDVKHIPNTSTGHVRRELKEKIEKDYSYKRLCRKSINTDPHIFNLLQMAFMRSGTHTHHMFSRTLSCMMWIHSMNAVLTLTRSSQTVFRCLVFENVILQKENK